MKLTLTSNPLKVEQAIRDLEARLISIGNPTEMVGLLTEREGLIKILLLQKVALNYYSSFLETMIEREPEIQKLLDELRDYVDQEKWEKVEGADNVSGLGMELRRIFEGLPGDH